MQSRNPDGYFLHPTSCTHFESRISARFCFLILIPELQIREILAAEKLLGTLLKLA